MKFCVIGLGRFGFSVATTLAENGMEVLAVDKNEQIVSSIRDQVTQAIAIDIINEGSLHTLGVEEMDAVVVAVGENFAQSILITALLKKRLHVTQVITRSIGNIHAEILKLVGADQIVLPEQAMGTSIADSLSLPFTVVARITPGYSVGIFKTSENFVGKTLEELNLAEKFGIICLGIKKDVSIVPLSPDYTLTEEDQLVCAGKNDQLQKLSK